MVDCIILETPLETKQGEVDIAMQEGWRKMEDREQDLKVRKREEALASKVKKKNRRKRKESSRWGG
jgi:predicted nucleotide-binding protein (sugar kinase/HSP70/actin superfamily)